MSGLAWMAVASAMFSAMTLLARLAADHASWALVAAVRAWMGVLVALVVARATGHAVVLRQRGAAWGRSLFGLGAMGCSFYVLGSRDIAVGDIATLRATAPLLVAVLAAIFLRERPTRAVYFAVPLGFVGIVVLVRPTFTGNDALVLITAMSSVFSALAMLFLRRLGPGESPEAVAIHFGVVAGCAMTGLGALLGPWPSSEGGELVVAAGITGGLGQLCMTRAYAREKAAAVSAMGYLSVALTHVGAFLWLDEPVDAAGGTGALLVVSAGLLLVFGGWWGGAPKSRDERP